MQYELIGLSLLINSSMWEGSSSINRPSSYIIKGEPSLERYKGLYMSCSLAGAPPMPWAAGHVAKTHLTSDLANDTTSLSLLACLGCVGSDDTIWAIKYFKIYLDDTVPRLHDTHYNRLGPP